MLAPRTPRASGLTLIELLVVVAIIMLLSAVTLPTAYVAFAERAVSEGAGVVQANISMTSDRAAGTGQPQGVRFLPDPDLSDFLEPIPARRVIASNRMITLTTPPSYSEGLVVPIVEIYTLPSGDEIQRLAIYGAKSDNNGLPSSPNSWYFNIRQGEKIRIDGSGNEFTIAGPITRGPLTGNPERFINQTVNGQPGGDLVQALPVNSQFEVLYVVNGRDDTGNGYIDPQFDGIDNNGDGFIDPGYNGIDDNGNGLVDEPLELVFSGIGLEFESDAPIGRAFRFARLNGDHSAGIPLVVPYDNQGATPTLITDLNITRHRYVISRRPAPARDAREYTLPGGAVIDFTTAALGPASERSRVPIDPATGYVDLIIYPNGQVIPSTPYGMGRALDPDYPFFFLWIAAREDVHLPQIANPLNPIWPALPLPSDPSLPSTPVLEGYRRMVTLSPRTGQTSVSEISEFGQESAVVNPTDRNVFRELPYNDARRLQQTGR